MEMDKAYRENQGLDNYEEDSASEEPRYVDIMPEFYAPVLWGLASSKQKACLCFWIPISAKFIRAGIAC